MRGFLGTPGNFVSVSPPGTATSLVFLGINNNDRAAGTTIGGIGVGHGFIYDIDSGDFTFVNVPGMSKKAAFGVKGDTVNGLNDEGDLVGFFSDGTKVHGFLAVPASGSGAGSGK